MRISLIIILFILLSCKREERVWTNLIDECIYEHAESIWPVYNDLDYFADLRPEALQYKQKIDSFIRIREQAGINLNKINNKLDVELLYVYLDYLTRYSKLIDYESEKQYAQRISALCMEAKQFLTSYEISNSDHDLFHFLNTTLIAEERVVKFFDAKFNDGHGIYAMDFYYHKPEQQKDSVFKMILTLKPAFNSKFYDVEIDSIILRKNGKAILDDYKYEKIGGSAYFEFYPNGPGNYSFSGTYSLTFKDLGYEKIEKFEAKWIAKE